MPFISHFDIFFLRTEVNGYTFYIKRCYSSEELRTFALIRRKTIISQDQNFLLERDLKRKSKNVQKSSRLTGR